MLEIIDINVILLLIVEDLKNVFIKLEGFFVVIRKNSGEIIGIIFCVVDFVIIDC